MTRIDFYLTREASKVDKDITVCKLAHKAFRLGHEIYILTPNSRDAIQLDRLLWTFNAGSFIPHGRSTDEAEAPLPVLVGEQEPPERCRDVLISLTATVPDFFSRFGRVVDIVGPTPEARQQARARYRYYREHGHPLETHQL